MARTRKLPINSKSFSVALPVDMLDSLQSKAKSVAQTAGDYIRELLSRDLGVSVPKVSPTPQIPPSAELITAHWNLVKVKYPNLSRTDLVRKVAVELDTPVTTIDRALRTISDSN
jgi:hypothetical protein